MDLAAKIHFRPEIPEVNIRVLTTTGLVEIESDNSFVALLMVIDLEVQYVANGNFEKRLI